MYPAGSHVVNPGEVQVSNNSKIKNCIPNVIGELSVVKNLSEGIEQFTPVQLNTVMPSANDVPKVSCKFGDVAKGSLLSYQQRTKPSHSPKGHINIDAPDPTSSIFLTLCISPIIFHMSPFGMFVWPQGVRSNWGKPMAHSGNKVPFVWLCRRTSLLKRGEWHTETKKSHACYYQVCRPLLLSETEWVDLFVMCNDDYHLERIRSDSEMPVNNERKLDQFYFEHFLPSLMKS